MKPISIYIIIFIINIQTKADNFENYRLNEIGYISIPNCMELQTGNNKKLNESIQNEFGKKLGYEISSNRIVLQQKGLNELDKNGFASYASVIV